MTSGPLTTSVYRYLCPAVNQLWAPHHGAILVVLARGDFLQHVRRHHLPDDALGIVLPAGGPQEVFQGVEKQGACHL